MSTGQTEIGIHDWDILFRNLRQFITLNGLAQELRVSSLVTHPYYEQMCDLCAPDLPENKTIEELERIVNQRLGTRRSDIEERHVFRQRKQGESESVIEYLQSLKQLAKTCNFGYTLEINLRDQFVSGLRDENIRSRLFAEQELDYKRAIELALELESAADAASNPTHAQSRAAAAPSGEAAATPAPAGARSRVDHARARCRSKVKRSTIAGEVYPSRPPDHPDSDDDEDEDMEVPGGDEGLEGVASTTAHGTHTEAATAGAQNADVHSTSAAAQGTQAVAGPKVLVAAAIAQDRAAHATASTFAYIADIMTAHARSIAAIFADMVAAMTSVKNEGGVSVTVPPQDKKKHSSDAGAPPCKIRKVMGSKVAAKERYKSKPPAHNDDKDNLSPPRDDADSDDNGGRVEKVKPAMKMKKSHKQQPQSKDNRRSSRHPDRKTVPDRLPEKHRSRKPTGGGSSHEERRSASSDSGSGSNGDLSPAKPHSKRLKRKSSPDKERRSARSDSGSDSDGDLSTPKPRSKRQKQTSSPDKERRSARSDSGSDSDGDLSPAKPRSKRHKQKSSPDKERRSARSDSGSDSDGDLSLAKPRSKRHKQKSSPDKERRSARSDSGSDSDGDLSLAKPRSKRHKQKSSPDKERRSARSDSGSDSDGDLSLAKPRSKRHKQKISPDKERRSARSDSGSDSDGERSPTRQRNKQHKLRILSDGEGRSARSDSRSGSDGERSPTRQRNKQHKLRILSDGEGRSARSDSRSGSDGDLSPAKPRSKRHKQKSSPDKERRSARSDSGSGSDGERSPTRHRNKQHKLRILSDEEGRSARSDSGSGSDGDRSPAKRPGKQHKQKVSSDGEGRSVRADSGSGSDEDQSPASQRSSQHSQGSSSGKERRSARSDSGSGSGGERSPGRHRKKQHKLRISPDGERRSARSDSGSGSDAVNRRSKKHKRRVSVDGKRRPARSDSGSDRDGEGRPARSRIGNHMGGRSLGGRRPASSDSGSDIDGGKSDDQAVVPGVEIPDVEATPTGTTSVIVEETPTDNTSVIVDETPTENTSVIVEETPTGNTSVIVEETPTDNTSVIVEETPTDNTSVIVEETPTDNTSVIVEETPTDNTSPVAGTAGKKRWVGPFKNVAGERLTPECNRPVCDHKRHPCRQPDNGDDIEDPDRMDESEDTNGQPRNVMPSMPSLSTWKALFEPRKGGRMGEFDYPSSHGQASNMRQNEQMGGDDAQVNDEEIGVGETFVNYMPSKLNLGLQHPDPVVETASLSSVEPVDVTYELSLPDDLINKGLLSALQLEAVVYASQAHEHLLPDNTRAGFLIGDGTGTGKGRMIAGIIFENYLRGRKRAIWVSVSRVLKNDAERDLRDIGASNIEVHGLDKIKYGEISTAEEGVIFCTYSALIGETQSIVDTKYRTRLKQLREWCGDNFDGVIVFDECHKAKNLYTATSKISLAVLELQTELPNARVVYVSATGASGPRNMAYMVRLGIWGDSTPFETFNDFIRAIEKRGVSAMEIIAMDMKLRGMYIARQLSFHGASFNILEVPMSKSFKETYDKSVRLWVVAMQRFAEAAMLINMESSDRTTMWSQFWSSHQRFFKYLCVAAKVKRAVSIATKAVKDGKCVVIGLLSTGEASTLDQVERDDGELAEFVSTAKGVFQSLVEKYFPRNSFNYREGDFDSSRRLSAAAGRRPESDSEEESEADTSRGILTAAERQTASDGDDLCGDEAGPSPIQRVRRMKEELLKEIEILGRSLPSNTLDKLVDELGGPSKVAEITGRRGRVVQARGQIQYERRSEAYEPLDILNLAEKQRFMDGKKNVVIISEAASCGISLQSDKRVPNQKKRVHITLELSFSAEVAVQQFGRTHRSNQVNAPEYIFLISDLKGERRFASILAKRLESLGALTHGDRRAKDSWDLSQFNIDNKYGCAAIKTVIGAIVKKEIPLVAQPSDYPGNFFQDVAKALEDVRLIINNEAAKQLNKDSKTMTVFLNRILGIPVDLQNKLFQYFADTLAANIEQARQDGTLDLGIQDLGSGDERVRHEGCQRYWRQHATGCAPVELHTVRAERGMDWPKALAKYFTLSGTKEGFYVSKQSYESKKHTVVLCVAAVSSSGKHNMFQMYSPNTGLQLRPKSLAEIEKKYRKVTSGEAVDPWCAQFNASLDDCMHTYLQGSCRDAPDCEGGRRSRTLYVLAGLVLPVWARVERVLRARAHYCRAQVVRVKLDDGRKIIGTLIPKSCVEPLKEELSFDAVSPR